MSDTQLLGPPSSPQYTAAFDPHGNWHSAILSDVYKKRFVHVKCWLGTFIFTNMSANMNHEKCTYILISWALAVCLCVFRVSSDGHTLSSWFKWNQLIYRCPSCALKIENVLIFFSAVFFSHFNIYPNIWNNSIHRWLLGRQLAEVFVYPSFILPGWISRDGVLISAPLLPVSECLWRGKKTTTASPAVFTELK